MVDFTSSLAFRVAGPKAFAEAGITPKDVDHLMIYDAFFRLSIHSFEDLGFKPPGEAGAFIAERNTVPDVPGTARRAARPRISLNTNGGGLSYMPSGMYVLQESVRQMRGTAPAQIPDTRISPRSRSATGSAGCSPPPVRSSCRTRRLKPRCSRAIALLASGT